MSETIDSSYKPKKRKNNNFSDDALEIIDTYHRKEKGNLLAHLLQNLDNCQIEDQEKIIHGLYDRELIKENCYEHHMNRILSEYPQNIREIKLAVELDYKLQKSEKHKKTPLITKKPYKTQFKD